MRRISVTIALVCTAAPLLAEPVKLKPLIDARLRYEGVDQTGIANRADAVTARVRAGFEAKAGDFAFLAEAEGSLAISENYNSGVNGKTAYPLVGDPQNIELNRLQLQYRGLPKTVVTVGRQRVVLDDQRFVGSAPWRDSEQTFDAARIEWTGVKNLKADLTYAWSVRSIWGINGGNRFGPARYPSIGGNNVFANLALTTKAGTLTGFAYLVDQDEPLVPANSSVTYGARFAGAYAFPSKTRLTYALSYARQNEYRRNPNRYMADYAAGDLGLVVKGWTLGTGFEILGASSGAALTSFQTPLATLHKFNGWADKFLVTPPNGLRSVQGSVAHGWTKLGKIDALMLTVIYRRFNSDRASIYYGDEIDLQAVARVKRTTFTLKYADYRASAFATNTRKFWASVEWAL